MGQIGQHRFHDPIAGVGVAKGKCLQVIPLGLLVVLLLIVDDSEFGIDEGIRWVDLFGLSQ